MAVNDGHRGGRARKKVRLDTSKLAEFADVPFQELEQTLATMIQTRVVADHVRPRLQEVRDKVSSQLTGRDRTVEVIMASLISGVPVILLGPTGTAKSACVRMIADHCRGARSADPTIVLTGYFEYLVTNHTMPEEIFGPPRIDLLTKEGVFQRRIDRMLPRAEFAFLDEVFRGGGHILNTLLSIINERRFHDGVRTVEVPLLGVVAAANSPPHESDVAAFFDRFPIRIWLPSVLEELEPDQVEDVGANLLTQSLKLDHDWLRRRWRHEGDSTAMPHLACTNDFRVARAHLTAERFGRASGRAAGDRVREFLDMFDKLRRSHELSDRSIGLLWRFGAALDWLRGNAIEKSQQSSGGSSRGHLEALTLVGSTIERARHAEELVDEYCEGRAHTGVY